MVTSLIPIIFDIFLIVSAPPGAHKLTAASPLLIASAYALHPAYPHAPQLTPGNVSINFSTFGSNLTSNFFAAIAKNNPKNNPIPPKANIALTLIIFFNNLSYIFIPLKPINAIAKIPAVTNTIATPLNASGISEYSSLSLIPAINKRAIEKPTAAAKPFTVASIKLYSF